MSFGGRIEGPLNSYGYPTLVKQTYLAHCPGTRIFKGGQSHRPLERVAGMHSGSPLPIVLVATWPTNCEQELLRRLSEVGERSHGEWFRADPAAVADVVTDAVLNPYPGALPWAQLEAA